MQKELQFLEEQDISPTLLAQVEAFRQEYPADEAALQRVNRPNIPFYGKEILEMAMAALLQGSNLLLSGAKATGKNILAENLAWIFGRPSYNISFNVNTDSSTLIGTDTFRNNQVELRQPLLDSPLSPAGTDPGCTIHRHCPMQGRSEHHLRC